MRLLLFPLAAAALLGQDVIHLKSRDRFTGRDREAHLATPLRRMTEGWSHYLVTVEPGRAAQLAASSVRLLRSAGDGAVIVSAPDGFDWNAAPVRWAGRMEAADKISPLAREAGGFVVEFHPDADESVAARILSDAGLPATATPLSGHVVIEADLDRVSRLAEWDEVAYIFPASDALRRGGSVTACFGALSDGMLVPQSVKVGAGWPMRDGVLPLDWSIASLTAKLPSLTAKSEIARALGEWARYAPIRWTQTASPDALRTLKVIFRSMDGPGMALAQTYYPAPPNPEPVAGDMHFDTAESWAVGRSIDLYSVALHEAGHALGLGHSDNPGAVMYPYYRQASGLSIDDINGIRDLYPSSEPIPADPTGVPPAPPQPASPDTTPPVLSILSPSTALVSTRASSLALSGSARDNIGVARVTWESSGGGSGPATGTTAWSASAPLRVGLNYITIRAFDAADNQVWRTVRVTRY